MLLNCDMRIQQNSMYTEVSIYINGICLKHNIYCISNGVQRICICIQYNLTNCSIVSGTGQIGGGFRNPECSVTMYVSLFVYMMLHRNKSSMAMQKKISIVKSLFDYRRKLIV